MTDIVVKRGTTVRYRWLVTHPDTGNAIDITTSDFRVIGQVRPIAGGTVLFTWDSDVVDGGVERGVGYVQIELTEDQSRAIGGSISRAVYQVLLRKISTDEVTEVDSGKLLFETPVAEW